MVVVVVAAVIGLDVVVVLGVVAVVVGRLVIPSMKMTSFSWSQLINESGDWSTDGKRNGWRKKRKEREEDSLSAISWCLCQSVWEDVHTQAANVRLRLYISILLFLMLYDSFKSIQYASSTLVKLPSSKYGVVKRKVCHKSEKKMYWKMKMTSQRAENLVHVH